MEAAERSLAAGRLKHAEHHARGALEASKFAGPAHSYELQSSALPQAQFLLSRVVRKRGGTHSLSEAVGLLKEAAAAGHAFALCDLMQLVLEEPIWDEATHAELLATVVEWTDGTFASTGHTAEPFSLVDRVCMRHIGLVRPQRARVVDRRQSPMLFRLAALALEEASEAGDADAAYTLGRMHEDPSVRPHAFGKGQNPKTPPRAGTRSPPTAGSCSRVRTSRVSSSRARARPPSGRRRACTSRRRRRRATRTASGSSTRIIGSAAAARRVRTRRRRGDGSWLRRRARTLARCRA